jgi:hypothetical protein
MASLFICPQKKKGNTDYQIKGRSERIGREKSGVGARRGLLATGVA